MNSEVSRKPKPSFARFTPVRFREQRALEAIVRRYPETGFGEVRTKALGIRNRQKMRCSR